MNTKQVCEIIPTTPKALRIYEENGLIRPARGANGYRNYSDEDVIRLREIRLLKEMGFSLTEIKTLTAKNKAETGPHKFLRSLYFQLKIIKTRMEELENISTVLGNSITDLLNAKASTDYSMYYKMIFESLEHNKVQRQQWIDRWGFDHWASSYDESVTVVGDELNIFQGYSEVLGKVRHIITDAVPSRVLDIGCGTGRLCGELGKNIEVVGIDQSIEMLLIARNSYPAMTLRLGNFLDQPYCRSHFDIVVSTYAFHHLKPEEKLKAIRCMCDYLKERGKIVIADLMFLNTEARDQCRQTFLEQGRPDLWNIVEDEYYSIIQDLENFVWSQGLKFHYEHLVNFTWVIIIEK